MPKNLLAAFAAAVIGISLLVSISACGQQPTVLAEDAAQVETVPEPIPLAPAPALEAPLLNLITAGKIEATVAGSSIESVSLSVRNLTAEPIRVLIPAGTFFASNSDSAQSMIATAPQIAYLQPNQETFVSISTACANLPLDIPHSGNTFTIAQAPPKEDLSLVAPLLAAETYAVQQAAVWIITDDANFGGLGILVRSDFSGIGGARVIGADDAARAMRVLTTAGVDLRDRSILSDRMMLAETVQDAELRAWLTDLDP